MLREVFCSLFVPFIDNSFVRVFFLLLLWIIVLFVLISAQIITFLHFDGVGCDLFNRLLYLLSSITF